MNRFEKALQAASQAAKLFETLGEQKGQAVALQAIAVSLFLSKKLDGWPVVAEQALEIFRKIGCSKLVAFELQCIAHFHLLKGDAREALSPARDALVVFQSLNKTGYLREALAFDHLVQAYLLLGQPGDAVDAAQKGLERFQQARDKTGEAAAQDLLAQACTRWGEYQMLVKRRMKAKRFMDGASRLYEKHSNQDCASHALYELTMMHLANKKPLDALKTATLFREHLQSANNHRVEGVALLLICLAHYTSAQFRECRTVAHEVQTIFDKQGQTYGQALALSLIAESHLAAGDGYDIGRRAAHEARHLLQAMQGHELEETQALLSVCWFRIASLLESRLAPERDGLHEILQAVKEGERIARKHGDQDLVACSLCLVAQIHSLGGRSEDVIRASREAAKIYQQFGNHSDEASALLLCAEALVQVEKYQEARDTSVRVLQLVQNCADSSREATAQQLVEICDLYTGRDRRWRCDAEDRQYSGAKSQDAMMDAHAVQQQINEIAGRVLGLGRNIGVEDCDFPLIQPGLTGPFRAMPIDRAVWLRHAKRPAQAHAVLELMAHQSAAKVWAVELQNSPASGECEKPPPDNTLVNLKALAVKPAGKLAPRSRRPQAERAACRLVKP